MTYVNESVFCNKNNNNSNCQQNDVKLVREIKMEVEIITTTILRKKYVDNFLPPFPFMEIVHGQEKEHYYNKTILRICDPRSNDMSDSIFQISVMIDNAHIFCYTS